MTQPAPTNQAQIREAAKLGVSGPSQPLPHLDTIQRSFGRHSVSTTKAHTDEKSKAGSQAMGARAFVTGNHVAFADQPDLRIASHEAAHLVQQRARLALANGLGQAGDLHEKHADKVADRVVRGESSESLLDAYTGHNGPSISARPGEMIQRDEARPIASKNDEWKGQETGPLATPGDKYTSDPYDHTVVVVKADGTGIQYTYQLADTEDGPRERLIHTETLSPFRVKALERMNAAGAGEEQEEAGGPAARKERDHQIGEAARVKWDEAQEKYKEKLAKYKADLDALPPEKKNPPPPPPVAPRGARPEDKKTTMCTDWPGTVYHSAGGNRTQSFNFTPPTDLPSWRTLAKNPEGPRPGDIYYLWDIKNNRAAHMGVFKSASPIPNHEDLMLWVVTDGGQGTYEGIQMVNERSRTFNKKTGIFSSNLAEAGQDKGDRKLVGWVDIDAQHSAKP